MSTRTSLPAGWRWAQAGELLTRIEAGVSPMALDRPAEPKERGVLKVSAVTSGYFRASENKALPDDYDCEGKPTVQLGDILISRANTQELVGAVALCDSSHPNLLLSDKILRLVPNRLVDAHFLARALRTPSVRGQIEARATGTSGSMRNISQDVIRQIELPLPPLPEQHRIAAILDKADAIRRKRREVVKLADAFLNSAFLEMFGDPVGNPRGWSVVDLERTFADSPQLGTLVPVEESGTIPVVRVGQLGQPAPDWSSCGQVSLDRKEIDRYLLRPNDLLMARAIGSLDHLGKASIVCADDPPAVFDSHVMRLRFDQNVLASAYFHTLLLTPGGRARFLVQASRTAVQFNISGGKIARMRIPLPPPELQANFVQLRERTLAMASGLQEAEVTAGRLFDSLVERAFSGAL